MKEEQEKPIGLLPTPAGVRGGVEILRNIEFTLHPLGPHARRMPPNAMASPSPLRNYIWALGQGTCIKIQLRVLNTKWKLLNNVALLF